MEFIWNLNPWFLLRLLGFFASLVILTSWINRFLLWRCYFDRKYLPCFAWGWCVYFLIYMLGREGAVSVDKVHYIFTSIALGVPCVTVLWKGGRHSPMKDQKLQSDLSLEKETLLLLGVFVGIMIYVGPYLEFPSDPLYHLTAMQSWEAARWLHVVEERASHFVYFVNHWLLQSSNISWGERTGVTLLTAILEGMLLWHFIRFTRVFTQHIWVGWGGGLASIGLFGTNVFSYYRYYVLADSFIAYFVFLEALCLVCCCFIKERFRYLLLLPPLLAFCWQNHPQEVLLLVNAGGGMGLLLLIFRYRTLSLNFRRPLAILAGLGLTGVILVSVITKVPILSLKEEFYLQKIMDGLLESPLYVVRFSRLNDVMGVWGWMAMVGSVIVLFSSRSSKKLIILAGICFWPLIVLWNPPAIALMLRAIPSSSILYRLIYGSLYWIFLAIFLGYMYEQRHRLFQLLPWFSLFQRSTPYLSRFQWAVILVVFLGSTLIPHAPIRGKILHLLTKTETQLDGRELNPVIRYLRQEAPRHCIDPYLGEEYRPVRRFILSDPYINQYLLATGYFYTMTDRWRIINYNERAHRDFPNQFVLKWFKDITKKLQGSQEIPVFPDVLRKQNICYVVLYSGNPSPSSRIGSLSGHWTPDFVNIQHDYSKKLLYWIQKYSQDFQLVFHNEGVHVYEVL